MLVEAHLDSDPFLPVGCIVVVQKHHSSHGGGVINSCKSNLLVNVIDCTEYYVSRACEIVAVLFQGTTILCVYHQPGGTNLMVRKSLNH